MQINTSLRFLGNRAADHIANGQCVMPLPIALAQRGKGIGRLTALGNCKHKCLVTNRGIAIAEFTGVFHLDRDPCQFFDHILSDQRSVPTRATGRKNNTVDLTQLLRTQVESTKYGCCIVIAQTSAHGVAERLWLFVNFFKHVMRVTTKGLRYRHLAPVHGWHVRHALDHDA